MVYAIFSASVFLAIGAIYAIAVGYLWVRQERLLFEPAVLAQVVAGGRIKCANSCHLGDEPHACAANAAKISGTAITSRKRPATRTTAPMVTT